MYLQLKLSACILLITFRLCDSIGERKTKTPKRVCPECHVYSYKCDYANGCPLPIKAHDRYHPKYPVQFRTHSRDRRQTQQAKERNESQHLPKQTGREYIIYVNNLRSAKILYKMLKPVTNENPPMKILIKMKKANKKGIVNDNIKPQTKTNSSGKSPKTESNEPKKNKNITVKVKEMSVKMSTFIKPQNHRRTNNHKMISSRTLKRTTAATETPSTPVPRQTSVPRAMIISDDSIKPMPPERKHAHEVISTRTEPKFLSVLLSRQPCMLSDTKQATSRLSDNFINFGFLLQICHDNHRLCSGALISVRLVLTSAHCFHTTPKVAQQLKVATILGQEAAVAELVIESDNKLAFLVLQQPIHQLRPIPICAEALQLDDSVIMLTANGKLNEMETRPSHVISNAACKLSYLHDETAFVTADMICVQNAVIAKACTTGVGDAMLRNGRLCGVNIYGSNCRDYVDNGDLYANIYKVIELVQNIISIYDQNYTPHN